MAVVIVGSAAAAGFATAIEAGRGFQSADKTQAGYVSLAAAALAYKTEFLSLNAASSVPLTDATVAIAEMVFGATLAALEGKTPPLATGGGPSSTAADYAQTAGVALALAQSQVANLT